MNVLIDTGASCSIIDIGSVRKLGLSDTLHPSPNYVIDASGNNMDILGEIFINISAPNIDILQKMKVIDTTSYKHVILGRDFLEKFNSVAFNFSRNTIKLGEQWHSCVKLNGTERVNLLNKVTLQGRSESIVNVRCKKSLSLMNSDFEPISIANIPGIYATRCRVVPDVDGVFQISILNANTHPVVIPSQKYLGKLHVPHQIVASLEPCTVASHTDFEASIKHGENLSTDERQRLISLISNFQDVFASNPKKPTLVKNMEHRIITENAQPVRQKARRIPHAWVKEVNAQVQEMLINNIIQPSSSPWDAPVILVKKKDNLMRFVCDFRGLNDVTKKDSYPLPHIRDVIDSMDGTIYWSTLDAASAYWSLPLTETDKEKTAFAIPRGKFEFNVTPFGLCNAGASYQRMTVFLLTWMTLLSSIRHSRSICKV